MAPFWGRAVHKDYRTITIKHGESMEGEHDGREELVWHFTVVGVVFETTSKFVLAQPANSPNEHAEAFETVQSQIKSSSVPAHQSEPPWHKLPPRQETDDKEKSKLHLKPPLKPKFNTTKPAHHCTTFLNRSSSLPSRFPHPSSLYLPISTRSCTSSSSSFLQSSSMSSLSPFSPLSHNQSSTRSLLRAQA